MAKRTTSGALFAVIALTLTAVSACGGDDSSAEDGIAGAQTPAPTESPDDQGNEDGDNDGDDDGTTAGGGDLPDDGIDRPDIPEWDQFTMTFEGWISDDPEENAVLRDGRERVRSVHAAVLAGDTEAEYLTFYSGGDALRSGVRWVEGFLSNDLTLIGAARFFDPALEELEGGAYELTYCADETAGDTKPRDEEEWEQPSGSGQVLVQYRTTLNQTEEGVWRTTLVITGEEC
jgi:hypothetical protein